MCFELKFFECDLCNMWMAEKKSSSIDSFFHKRVHRTRFLCTKTKSSGLDLYVQKPSSKDSISMYKNRV